MSYVDVRKVVRYPPEAFVVATPADLSSGENRVADYTTFPPYVIVLQGFSFAALDGASFYVDVDGRSRYVYLENLASARGLDFEEGVKVPATRAAYLKLYSPSSVSGYQLRHRVVVFRPTTALKMQLGMELTARDRELAGKLDLVRLLGVSTPKPFDLAAGVERVFTVAGKQSPTAAETRTVARLVAPDGHKLILLAVSAARPVAPGKAYLHVYRDDLEVMKLDLYCLPSLSYEAPVRVVALDKVTVDLEMLGAGSYSVRLVYGVGRLTVKEKIAWGLELTAGERSLAEELSLFDKVEAGVE